MNGETKRQIMERWLSDGDTWIGVFENHALDSSRLGDKIAIPFSLSDGSWDRAELGDRAPDTKNRINWAYLLVAKCRTIDEVIHAGIEL